MARRQYYNVNTQTKLIDTHNKFNGGLKTVDTDDALKDFFLRQAENVSISEFGFLEKRYGLSEKQKLLSHGGSVTLTDATRVQGHYKFRYGTSTDEILAVGGKLYVKEHGQTSFTVVSSFVANLTGQTYPDDTTLVSGFSNGTFQSTRDVGMARIKDNLFIFTGTYPLIYTRKHPVTGAALSNGTVYVMHYYKPSWTDILGTNTGLNLLVGDDFDDTMGYTNFSRLDSDTTYISDDTTVKVKINNIKSTVAPSIPVANYETTHNGEPAQIKLEASVNLTAPPSFFKKFASYTHSSNGLFYVQEDPPNSNYFYLDYSGTIATDGTTACTVENSRVVDDNDNYFVCAVSPTVTNDETNQNFQITPHKVQYREFGTETWIDVAEDDILDRLIYTNADSTSDFSNQPTELENKPNATTPGYSFLTFNTAPTTTQTLDPLHIVLKGFSSGIYDFKVEWDYERHYMDAQNEGHEVILSKFEVVYSEISIKAEKLTFSDQGFAADALITCNQVIERDGRLLAYGSTSMPEHLFFSSVQEYNYFPTSFSQQVDTNEDDPIKAIVPFMNVLVILTTGKLFGLKGDKPILQEGEVEGLYQTFPISPIYGTIAPKSVRPVRNRLYFLSKQGLVELNNLYAVDNRYNVNEIDRNIKNVVPQDENAVAIQHDYQYWINFPSTGETFRYYIDKKAWVKDSYGTDSAGSYDFDGVSKYYTEDGVLTFITNVTALDTSPAVNSIYEIEVDKTLPSDFTKTIKSSFETAALNQGYPFHLKKYYENRMDFTLQNEYNVSKDPITFTNPTEQPTYAEFDVTLLKNHQYQIGFGADYTITNIQYIIDSVATNAPGFSYDSSTYIAKFNIPYVSTGTMSIKVYGTDISLTDAVLRDITYDSTLIFNTHSLGDQTPLNFNNEGYDIEDTQVDINLGTVFGAGTWVFDESAFDDRIRAIRTVKLAGRGLNYKLFVTDRTKAKWTIENIGITFKIKRARKR